MFWLGIAIVVALVVGLVYFLYRRIRKRETRLISFVALLREPMKFDPAVLARVAGKVWNADLGDGSSEGADGFVASVEIITTIFYDERLFLLNSFPKPYVDNPEEAAADMPDLRLQTLFGQHRAWFSCDAMGVDASTPEPEIRKWYQLLGKLIAELLDDNCLLIYLPDSDSLFPVNEESEAALRSDDPIEALQETITIPIIQVADDDPLMVQAVERAHKEWPRFLAAFEAKQGENFSVKAPVTAGGNTEYIWIEVTTIEGDRIYGKLGNDPANLGKLKLGSKVSLPKKQINDWAYLDGKGDLVGGFTIEAIKKAAKRGTK